MMGLSFDANGRYIGWSNLFNYDTIENLSASEYLPMPRGVKYKIDFDHPSDVITPQGINNRTENSILNIDEFIDRIVNALSEADRIQNGYAPLLKYLYKYKITHITYTHPGGQEVVNKLFQHEKTKIPTNLAQDASKNFVSSHILNTILNLRNMIGAYSPIDIDRFGAAAESSPKGQASASMTMLNPATKLLMQYQNITGKNVIGIAANGEKASFMWHYVINESMSLAKTSNVLSEMILQPDFWTNIEKAEVRESLSERDREIANKLRYSRFNFTSNRIKGRYSRNGKVEPQPVILNILPNINMEINPALFEKYGVRQTGDLEVDLLISLVLSAATDFRINKLYL